MATSFQFDSRNEPQLPISISNGEGKDAQKIIDSGYVNLR